MDYVSLIKDAWTMTWRHKWLWILGLFAGSSGGSCSGTGANPSFQWNAGQADFDSRQIQPVIDWIGANTGLLLTIAAIFLILMLVMLVVSIVAKGGMVQATVDLATGQPSSLGRAFSAGLRFFWRFFLLGLIIFLIWLVLVLALGSIVLAGIAIGSAFGSVLGEALRILTIVGSIILVLLAILVLIPFGILLSIVVAWAQRVIVVDNVGPIAALRSGYYLLRARLGTSLIVWVITVGIGIAAGLALMLAIGLVVIAPLVVIGIAVYLAAGFGALTIAYIVLAVVLLVVTSWMLGAIINSYFWSYWTLAYLRIRALGT